jgi:hypothetical protein
LVISNLEKIKAMAVLVHSDATRIATEMLMRLPSHKQWNIKYFPTALRGLHWLEQHLTAN